MHPPPREIHICISLLEVYIYIVSPSQRYIHIYIYGRATVRRRLDGSGNCVDRPFKGASGGGLVGWLASCLARCLDGC